MMKGLWNKYEIKKTSGKPLDPNFFAIVLHIDGGQYVESCRIGVAAFAQAVDSENPILASDIRSILNEYNTQAKGKEEQCL